MASSTSHPSPYSSSHEIDSTGDIDESWQYLDYSSGVSTSGSIGFLSSPASGSLNGYAIVGQPHFTPLPSSASPLSLADLDPTMLLPGATAFSDYDQDDNFASHVMSEATDAAFDGQNASGSTSFLTPQQYLFSGIEGGFSQRGLDDLDMTPLIEDIQANLASEGLFEPLPEPNTLLPQNPSQQSLIPTFSSWHTSEPSASNAQTVSFEDLLPLISNRTASTQSSSPSFSSESPPLKSIKAEPPSSSSTKSSLALCKVKDGKVEKRKAEPVSKFVIMTPNSISANAGRANPFECFEAMRATQRGRKGPLPNDTKEDALQVRRRGACFCCHSRKVKCDKERPCKHCKRLMLQVPQVVCWRFQDFIPILFPDFIRSHFKKDEMTRFIRDNVLAFHVGGAERPCEVELFSGPRFSAILSVEAKFFTSRTPEVMQHWHMKPDQGRANLESNGSAPIGIDFATSAQRDDLRKRVKAYIQDIIHEPFYAEQVTDSFGSTQLPLKTLRIVQTYAKQSDSTMVKRALSIYAMHYIMTRHLCITSRSILHLQSSGLVPQNTLWITPRVLARQIKSLVDELIMREMQHIFELFSKSLKPKHRREWAPCTAAFLVLCLFMEAVETTAENFVLSQNEINRRNTSLPEYKPNFAHGICQELENMPFKQFAYQFHNVYQTHAKDAATKSFNPLFDDGSADQDGLDGPAVEMVKGLRELFYGQEWHDIQFLADDEVVSNRGETTRPIESSFLYTGRLVAKFLLSFTNESFIFGAPPT